MQRATSQGRLQVRTGLVLVAVLDLQLNPNCCHLQASPLEKAELYVTVAQAVQTMFCMYLRLHGISPEEHPIAKEEVSTAAERLAALGLELYNDLSCTVILSGAHCSFQKESQQGLFREFAEEFKKGHRSQYTGC